MSGPMTTAGGRRPIVAGNWKMHKTMTEARDTVAGLLASLTGPAAADLTGAPAAHVVVFPPSVALHTVCHQLAAASSAGRGPAGIELGAGAQNLHQEPRGAYTGEVSAEMIAAAGGAWALVGHSERRAHFGETDDVVGAKCRAALAAGLKPIVCVGETAAQRESAATAAVLTGQVQAATAGLEAAQLARLVVAYEPVWAIGSGVAATAADAAAAASTIRRSLPAAVAEAVPVLYGGSVKESNVAELMTAGGVDGVLVGGASLDGPGFATLALAGIRAKAG